MRGNVNTNLLYLVLYFPAAVCSILTTMTKVILKSRTDKAPLPVKFYLPPALDEYIRQAAKDNYRTLTGQIEQMLQFAKAAGK